LPLPLPLLPLLLPSPEHGFVHVVPAAHVAVLLPLHLAVHAPASPHAIVQAELPVQSTVQPPAGQLSAHVLLPWQLAVEPLPRFRLQLAPPPHVTLLLAPV
jgi:hypothetical protein